MSEATPKSSRNRPQASRGGPPPPRTTASERIAADLAAFRKAGGRIEKLGTTVVLKKIEEAGPPQTMRASGVRRGKVR